MIFRRHWGTSVQIEHGIVLIFISREQVSVQVDAVSNVRRETEHRCDITFGLLSVLGAVVFERNMGVACRSGSFHVDDVRRVEGGRRVVKKRRSAIHRRRGQADHRNAA